MADKRKIEIFGGGCANCLEAIEAVARKACSSREVIVRDMRDMRVAQRAEELAIRSVPAVMIDGKCVVRRGCL
jgi:glutaredoxin